MLWQALANLLFIVFLCGLALCCVNRTTLGQANGKTVKPKRERHSA